MQQILQSKYLLTGCCNCNQTSVIGKFIYRGLIWHISFHSSNQYHACYNHYKVLTSKPIRENGNEVDTTNEYAIEGDEAFIGSKGDDLKNRARYYSINIFFHPRIVLSRLSCLVWFRG